MKGLLWEKGAQIVLQDDFMFLEFRYTIILRGCVKDEVKMQI
jgi:hypothetical protein